MLTQEEIQNINSPRAIDNTKFAVKNLATKVTLTRFEISLKKKFKEGNGPTI